MNNKKISLVINTPFCKLPKIENDFFDFEGKEGVNIEEGITRFPYRRFTIKHPQSEMFLENLGEENTLTFYRLILSYYDSAFMLYDFTRKYSVVFPNEINVFEIEKLIENYNIVEFDYNSVDQNTYLSLHDYDRVYSDFHPSSNGLQELLWSMNLEKILSSHNISYYSDKVFTVKEKNTGNINLLVYKMIKNREVSMVMHTWRKLNSYDKSDFILNISNILEFIENDLLVNRDSFNTAMPEFCKLEDFVKLVSKKPTRKYYFGLFNSSDLFGFFSRHGSKRLLEYESVSDNKQLSIDQIMDGMSKNKIPNQNEIHYLFNFWHITTSIIVTLWFRVKNQHNENNSAEK